jgi:hypothetical protein
MGKYCPTGFVSDVLGNAAVAQTSAQAADDRRTRSAVRTLDHFQFPRQSACAGAGLVWATGRV